MKYPSVLVKVPGSGGAELWLSLTEAKRLRNNLDKKIKATQSKVDAKKKK